MVDTPRAAVLTGFGINCDVETMAVFEMAGAEAQRVHVNQLVSGADSLEDFHILAVPREWPPSRQPSTLRHP